MTGPAAHDGAARLTADVAVVGGGVAGLVAALDCARLGLRVVVLERADEPGGCVARIDLDGLALDAGAESFATRGGAVAELLETLGLADDVVAPNRAGAWLARPGRSGGVDAVPLPRTGMLGIPANPLGEDVRAVIGWGGAWRAYLDRLMPVLRIGPADSVGELVRTRMGRKVLDRLVTPISSGVYSTDPDDLDLRVVAPGLNQAMTRAGSLSGGVAQLVEERKAGTAVQGIRGGMHRLVDALLAQLARFDAVVVTGAEVVSLRRASEADAAPWRVVARTAEGEFVVEAPQTVLAASAAVSQRLLDEAAPGAPADDGAPTAEPAEAEAPVELVHLVLDAPALAGAPRGTGVLVAADVAGVAAKALTHSTAKWAWLAEVAGDRQVVRLSYGRLGGSSPLDGLDDDAIADLAVRDAARLLGVPLTRADVRAWARTTWRDARSRAALSRRGATAALEARIAEASDLEVTGSWVAGTGLASVVPHARETAHRVRVRAMERGDVA